MVYKVVVEKKASRKLLKMSPEWSKRILEKINHIATDPYGVHRNAKKLQNRDGYRLRVGDWRIFYKLEDKVMTLYMIDVLSRGSAYKK